MGVRRMTVVNDPALLKHVFNPDIWSDDELVGDAVKMEMDKIAHAWFGIPKDLCPFTRVGLDATRKTLGPKNVGTFNNAIGKALEAHFAGLGDEGTASVVQLTSATFWPVNQALFGAATLSPETFPDVS
eukprot:g5196.t1